MIKIRILKEEGYEEMAMEVSEVIDQINNHPTLWAFIDGEMVAREEIANINWDTVQSVDLAPPIAGGAQRWDKEQGKVVHIQSCRYCGTYETKPSPENKHYCKNPNCPGRDGKIREF